VTEHWADKINLTELTLMAQEVTPGATRFLGREKLLAIIEDGDVGGVPDSRPVDVTRLRIMKYVDANFDRVKPLLSCPAKTRDPRACFQCLDHQVLECAISSEATLKLGVKNR
jgi:hypothetical protein